MIDCGIFVNLCCQLYWTPPCVSNPEPRQTGPAAVEVGVGGEAGVGGPRVHGLQTREGITGGVADSELMAV